MTKNITMLVLGIVILIVNLAMGEDGVISRVATHASYQPAADGGTASAPAPVPETPNLANAGNALPAPDSTGDIGAEPAPEVTGPLPESRAPRVE